MQNVYVFDLDGCLCDCSHRLHHIKKNPKDWKAFFAEAMHDLPIEPVCALARDLDRVGTIIFASGRSDECREASRYWIEAHIGIDNPTLYMRKAGDHRDDPIVKLEMLAQMRRDGFEPRVWVDDRSRVVSALRGAGVRVLQCDVGDF